MCYHYFYRLTQVGVVVFSSGGAGGSGRRQRGLAACVLKPPCWMGPQPLLPFLMGRLSGGRRVPETHIDTVNSRQKERYLEARAVKLCADEMSAELHNRSMWADGKKNHAATPHRCSHACICTHTVISTHTALAQSFQTHWHCRSSLLSPAPKWLSNRRPPYRRHDNRPYLILWGW